jgi:dephospho-CoA kinase
MTNRIAAIVGMPGAGKSEVSSYLVAQGLRCIHFGAVTQEELLRRGLPVNEANERLVRESLRATRGMAAYALLNLERIDTALQSGSVVVDGLYSWEEYLVLKERYGERLVMVAVTASPATRARRLSTRPVRPLTADDLALRDRAEIEKLNKGGPIAMADIMLINEGTVQQLHIQTEQVREAMA